MNKLQIAGVVGKAGELMWSQAQTMRLNDNGGKWIILSMDKPAEAGLLDLGEIGGEILREWAEKVDLITTNTQAQKQTEKLLAGITENIKVELIQGCWDGNNILIWGSSQSRAYLQREGKIAKLGKTLPWGWWSSGELYPGDKVLLVNERWEQQIGISGIKSALAEEKLVESLPLLIQNSEEVEGLVGVAIELPIEEKSSETWWSKWRRNEPIKLKNENLTNRKAGLWVGGVVLIMLVLMIGIGVVRRERINQQNNYDQMEQMVRAKMSEAEMVVTTEPARVKGLLDEAKNITSEYLGTEPKESYKAQAVKLVAEIEQKEESLFKKNEVALTTVVELSVLDKELTSKKMRTDGKSNLLWLDENSPRIVAMNVGDRSKQAIEGDNLPEGYAIASSESEVFWLEKEGVWKASWKEKKLERVIVPDEFWQDPQIIDVFAGNVYVFDKSQSEIWKYPVLSDGYGSRRRWLAAGITPDLTKVIEMKVTGDIWLLTETGKIVRYNRGSPAKFDLVGYPYLDESELLINPRAMFVGENSIYISENGVNRIVALTQEGKFEAQYVNSEFANVDDLVVLDGKMYVLIDNVVKEFGL